MTGLKGRFMQFGIGSVELSTCTHGATLDYALMFRAVRPDHTLVLLKGRPHLPSGIRMLDSRTDEAIRYLVQEKGLDRRFILVQNDHSITSSTDARLAASVDVFVVFRGVLPNHAFVLRKGDLRPVDADGVEIRLKARPTSACSGARAARSFRLPLRPSRAPADA